MHSTLGNCPEGEGLDSKLLNFFSSCASFGPNTLSDKLIFLALLFRGSGLLKFGEPFSIDSKSALILIDGSDYSAAPGQILVQRAIYLVGRGEGGKWCPLTSEDRIRALVFGQVNQNSFNITKQRTISRGSNKTLQVGLFQLPTRRWVCQQK